MQRTPQACKRAAMALGIAGMLLMLSAPASADFKTVRWTHPEPGDVQGFNVHIGSSSRNYERVVSVGKPQRNNGVYSAVVDLGDGDDAFVAVSAFNGGGQSSFSNERRIEIDSPAAPLGKPGRPFVVE